MPDKNAVFFSKNVNQKKQENKFGKASTEFLPDLIPKLPVFLCEKNQDLFV